MEESAERTSYAKERKRLEQKGGNILNIATDALISITALGHDFFVTSDYCVFKCWLKVIEDDAQNRKAILEKEKHKIPKILFVHPSPQKVFSEIVIDRTEVYAKVLNRWKS